MDEYARNHIEEASFDESVEEKKKEKVENQQETQETVADTKTSAGDDFSESLLQPQTISVMNENELLDLKTKLMELYNELKNNRKFGVYSHDSSEKLIQYHLLSKKFYEQTKQSILIEPQEIVEDFIAEYYHIIDYQLKSTRQISHFYETESSINFIGIPDIVSRRKISRALVVN